MSGIQATIGAMDAKIEEAARKTDEKMSSQAATMNVVVDQARNEYNKIVNDQATIAIEAKAEFQKQRDVVEKLKEDCAKFR